MAETVEKLCFSDNLCLDYAKHESEKSSCTETFSLSKYKKSGTCPDFLCICAANAVLCALPRTLLIRVGKMLFRQADRTAAAVRFKLSTRTRSTVLACSHLLHSALAAPSANTSRKPFTLAAISPPNTAEPATITSAPAATMSAVLFSLAPPSISSSHW